MVHNTEGLSGIDLSAKKKITDQYVIFNKFKVTGVPVTPNSDYFWTNNFIQRTLNILLGFNSANEEFQLIGVDKDNNLSIKGSIASTTGAATGTLTYLKTDAGGRLLINTEENLKQDFVLIDNVTVADGGTAASTGVNVEKFTKKSLIVQTNRSMTVRVQGSDDDSNYFDWKTVADADITHNCSNEKILIEIPFTTTFFRVVVTNSAGASGEVSARLMCHA